MLLSAVSRGSVEVLAVSRVISDRVSAVSKVVSGSVSSIGDEL